MKSIVEAWKDGKTYLVVCENYEPYTEGAKWFENYEEAIKEFDSEEGGKA